MFHSRTYLDRLLPFHQHGPTSASSRVGTDGSEVVQDVEHPQGSCLWIVAPHLYLHDRDPPALGFDAYSFKPKQFLCLRLNPTTRSVGATESMVCHVRGQALGRGYILNSQCCQTRVGSLCKSFPREAGQRKSVGELRTGI